MSHPGWKKFERRVARLLGTERIPVTGERAGADFENALLCGQAKLGRNMPDYLREWLQGIRLAGKSRHPEKIGIVVWKPRHTHDAGAVVILALEDFVALHGAAHTSAMEI